jgi:hypothetical protein
MAKVTHKKPETIIQEAILEELSWNGVFAWRQNTKPDVVGGGGGRRARFKKAKVTGIPDILGICYNGKLLAIEVKTMEKDSKLTSNQEHFLSSLANNGGLAFVARSVDDVLKRMEEIKSR